jgi:predicted RNA-binding protein Jag
MKSLLQEGSSIIKAIEAAWIKVGMPAEFSVKVMRDAEKSFFGLATKNSAVISLCYDGVRIEKRPHNPKQQNGREEVKKSFNHEEILEKVMRDTKELQAKSNVFGNDLVTDSVASFKKNDKKIDKEQHVAAQQKQRSERPVQKKKIEKSVALESNSTLSINEAEVVAHEKKESKEQQEHLNQQWSQPMTDVVMSFLNEIFTIMELNITLAHKIEGLQLHVTLSQPVFDDADQEYKLFTSLAFLMIQKIKKDFRKKCKGYRVVFHSTSQPDAQIQSEGA